MLSDVRWLALDIGARRIGAAVCDRDERVATPLAALEFAGVEALAAAVARLLVEHELDGVVVGVPVTRAGTSRGEARVASVVAALRRQLAVPIETFDERGTTAAAEAALRESGVPPSRRRRVIDSVAAQLILEAFLERRRARPLDVDRPLGGC
jgi:putative Holliday junction resolvase